jgi:starvation-inducible DNA-binding protein
MLPIPALQASTLERAESALRTDAAFHDNTTMTINTSTPPTPNARLSGQLNQVLADSYALMALTHVAHWNVEGPGFFALHTAFQTQYEELFTAIDEIAERIRALGAYANGGLDNLARKAQMQEFAAPLPQEEYVRLLVVANEKLVADAARARETAGEANDPESQDLMIERITLHQKTIWMLNSFLKS